MRALLAFAVALTASPAVAQSIPGATLGETREAIINRYALPVEPVQGLPNAEVMRTREGGSIAFCRGVVSSVQELVGDNVHTFADLVSDAELRYGPGAYETNHQRVRGGELSNIAVRFKVADDVILRVGILEWENKLDVSRSYDRDGPCI